MSRIKRQDGGGPEVPEVLGERGKRGEALHTRAVWASLAEGRKRGGPGAWSRWAGAGRGPWGRSLDAQVRGKGRMQRAQGWGRVQLGLDLLG